MLWEIVSWVVFGAIAGWIASMLMHAEEGMIANIIVGIVGAVIGGYVIRLFGGSGVTGFNLGSMLTAIVGAVILLAILRAFRGGSRHSVA